MAIDPFAPVIIGVGQTVQHADDVQQALDPSLMMCSAIGDATVDAGLRSIPNPQSLRVVNLLTWKYGDPGYLIAQQLGLTPAETAYTTMGGQSPQTLVNVTASEIQSGDLDIAILAGGEARRTRVRARKAQQPLDWPTAPESQTPRIVGEELVLNHPSELARGVMMPVQIYPMFESAIRARSGATPAQHVQQISELWARFSEVAAGNPYAWSRQARTAEEIRTPSSENRMVGLPYTKYMNSNNDVDMAAAIIMCSAERQSRSACHGINGCSCMPARIVTSTNSSAIAGRSPRPPPSSSVAAVCSNWLAARSRTSGSSTCIRAFLRPCNSARRAWGCRSIDS